VDAGAAKTLAAPITLIYVISIACDVKAISRSFRKIHKKGDITMSWNSKYWDAVDNLYWTPKYLGIKSINKKFWGRTGDQICIPKKLVPNGCTLYTRRVKINEQIEQLHHSEEVLNHLFDITFAIAPDSLIEDILFRPLGLHDAGPFESIGREAAVRYNWGFKNVTQHDGFFTSLKRSSLVPVALWSKW